MLGLGSFSILYKTCCIIDYVDQFDVLVHQVLAHDPAMQSTYITKRLIDGTREDIKVVATIHYPVDLDVTYSFAILYKEVAGESPLKEIK
jgi:hypothetical protein